MIKSILAVGLGSFAGGAARYLVTRWVQIKVTGGFPLGTMVVNVAGCFVLGLLVGLLGRWGVTNAYVRLFLTVGFCGGFTTFSTFMGDNMVLAQGGDVPGLVLNIALSIAAGAAALWLGGWVSRL